MKSPTDQDRNQTQAYPLRLPPEIKNQLAAKAIQSRRSLNGEIVNRLEKSLADDPTPTTQGAAQ